MRLSLTADYLSTFSFQTLVLSTIFPSCDAFGQLTFSLLPKAMIFDATIKSSTHDVLLLIQEFEIDSSSIIF